MSSTFCSVLYLTGIAVMVVSIWLVLFNVLKAKWHWMPLFVTSFCLIYAMTLLGPFLNGSDIGTDYYITIKSINDGGWFFDRSYGTQSALSFVPALMIPLISEYFHIDPVWVYKAVIPMFLVVVPVVLYYAFKNIVDPAKAFLAGMVIAGMPMVTLEAAGNAKTMVALMFYALFIYFMTSGLNKWKKAGAMIGCGVVTSFAHYTVGVFIIYFMLVVLAVKLASLFIKWDAIRQWKMSLASIAVVCIGVTGMFAVYYSIAGEGQMMNVVARIPNAVGFSINKINTTIEKAAEEENPISKLVKNQDENVKTSSEISFVKNMEPSIKLATGLDFMGASLMGKIFRVLQYLSQAMILGGCVYYLFRYRKYRITTAFIACVGGGLVLMLACIVLPSFSYTINASRFYLYSLFFFAPMMFLWMDYRKNEN